MSAKSYRRGVHRYTRHTCDACGVKVVVRGIMIPPGWQALGLLGIDDVVICTECVTEFAEVAATWVLQQQERFPRGRDALGREATRTAAELASIGDAEQASA